MAEQRTEDWWNETWWGMDAPEGFKLPYTELWEDRKAFRYHPRRAVVEWKRAVDFLIALEHLGDAASSEPLALALVDAKMRALVELQGAREQLAALES
jgi:hypothetical protein